MQMNSDAPQGNNDPRAIALFKVLAAFSRERHGLARIDDLDHCHWSDVARMIRKASSDDIEDPAASNQALKELADRGLSPARLAASLARVAGEISIEGELSVGAMTLQVMREVARRRRLSCGRRWLKRSRPS